MTAMNKWMYCFRVDSMLPCTGKQKKLIMREIRGSIDQFCKENGHTGYQQLVERFGKPEQVAASYVDTEDSTVLIGRLRIKGRIVRTVSVAVLIAAALWGAFLISTFVSFADDMSGRIYSKIEIVEEETNG